MSCVTKSLMALTAKQATLDCSISISIWLFHINILSIIIPSTSLFVVLDFILLSRPTQMGICELFLVKDCMRLVF
jgi:hypothetical protein